MKKMMKRANEFVVKQVFIKARLAVSNNKGEGYIDTAVKILIAVVLGALLLASLYALFGDGYADIGSKESICLTMQVNSILQAVLFLVYLAFAAYTDIKKREVPGILCVAMVLISLLDFKL